MADTNRARVFVKISLLVFLASVVVLLVLGILIVQSKNDLVAKDEEWYLSFLIADELRQSSDDLTNFIRMYAATQDLYYKKIYFQVLAIRNGAIRRPEGYEQIYWDLRLPAQIDASYIRGQTLSIREKMQAIGFTEDELSLLQKAEDESNSLVAIELRAMRAIENIMTETDLVLIEENESQQEFAIRILNDSEYLQAKYKIMEPIQQFYTLFEKRTTQQKDESLKRTSLLTNVLFIFVACDGIVFFVLFSHIFRLFKDNERLLESKIMDRTMELKEKNEYLTKAKDQLVEAEKMASLGGLVAGVAHEINTPIGIGVTLSSHLSEATGAISKKLDTGQLSKASLSKYLDLVADESKILSSNMKRAGDLISSFKQVAVDQSNNEHREIDVKEYIDEILLSLYSKFKHTNYEISLKGIGDMTLLTYPGAIYQIITNLVLNSLIHGFENRDYGQIDIFVEGNTTAITIRYEDDGIGIADEHVSKIFEPFFTTKRGSGGSGLGMNIVYNLVSQKLGGTIRLKSVYGQGVNFLITIPRS